MFILIANPGSSSRKYSFYRDRNKLFDFHFEIRNHQVVGSFKSFLITVREFSNRNFESLDNTVAYVKEILTKNAQFSGNIDAILVRTVGTGDYLARDHVVDDECLEKLQEMSSKVPLHLPTVIKEIEALRENFSDSKICTISDAMFAEDEFGSNDLSKMYAINQQLADDYEIKRYGAHGLSVRYVLEKTRETGYFHHRLIVCHIGSGVSVTAADNVDRFIYDTSMGYSPLEGAMMATRCGNIDTAAALELGRRLGLDYNNLELYLNKMCGIKGMTGKSGLYEVMNFENINDQEAYDLFIYRIQLLVGEMAAAMGGVEGIVFTATIGERNWKVREDIIENLSFLGFEIEPGEQFKLLPEEIIRQRPVNIGKNKPILVLKTNEDAAMIKRANELLC